MSPFLNHCIILLLLMSSKWANIPKIDIDLPFDIISYVRKMNIDYSNIKKDKYVVQGLTIIDNLFFISAYKKNNYSRI